MENIMTETEYNEIVKNGRRGEYPRVLTTDGYKFGQEFHGNNDQHLISGLHTERRQNYGFRLKNVLKPPPPSDRSNPPKRPHPAGKTGRRGEDREKTNFEIIDLKEYKTLPKY
jgi:hypothetical protein